MSPTLKEQADKHATDLAKVKTETPSKFVVGGTWDGHKVQGGISYDRKWYNGFGATAYLRAWYDDKPIIPVEKAGFVIGGEGTYTFGPKP